jgi:hypothetical protein|nr:hypothetical protein [uncultured Flavobacterium sp.]
MKTIKFLFLINCVLIIFSCSKKEDSSDLTCNDVVCGGANYGNGTYMIFRGTLDPDTCGLTELSVNATTYNFYKAKWDLNPEGYACWEGLK